ncbi:MAG: PoNe immunity protein domain-containing protein, partial [Bacteroidota bacterium]
RTVVKRQSGATGFSRLCNSRTSRYFYTMRDQVKDKKFFKNYLVEANRLIEKRLRKLREGLIKTERIQIVKTDMISQYLEATIATYSSGGSKVEMLSYYSNVFDLIDQHWNEAQKMEYKRKILDQYGLSNYHQILTVLSLGVLLDVSNKEFEKVARVIERDQVKDLIYSLIISHKLSDRQMSTEESYQDTFGVPEFYSTLREAVLEKDQVRSAELVQRFVEQEWYENFKKEGPGMVEIHNHPDNIYYGYWCFEAAAVVKIKGLDDNSFRDHPYYPADLVHGMDEPPKKKKGFLGW